jgi:putative ABC transport system substrate-binding protein
VEKLHEMVPTARVMAVLVNPSNPVTAEPATKDAHAAARTLGLHIHVIHAA